ncbi:hypothetical protein G7K71_02870 [Desulfofundulus sp. TPOSR]|uniref:hypothetical protein n=1 Tax=Desulfofundulus sp. TPOSR TaxID=2714340 RepID=UPI00140B73B7|nr:hypothetical protein [Desulfofundulus sp. TPOSR]NHM25969.1 hypothetical protein [Desulfofundulus sp. TPOSR]
MREQVLKIFTGPPEEVERRANEFLADKSVALADRVTVSHWGTDPVSLVVYVERDPDGPGIEAYYRRVVEAIRRGADQLKGGTAA